MRSLPFLPLLLTAAFAQDGTCTAGQDPIGVEQSCLGRCHIYYEGNYGACDSYQVTAKDANGPCGDSIKNPCISTFNAGWDPSLTNCGNCYYVEMTYEDGTVRSTYLKTIDTNGSETKFEMSQVAWTNLCPYLCAGTGTCGNTPEACQYGTQEMTGMPAPCAVQNAPITFKRIPCEDSANADDKETEQESDGDISTTISTSSYETLKTTQSPNPSTMTYADHDRMSESALTGETQCNEHIADTEPEGIPNTEAKGIDSSDDVQEAEVESNVQYCEQSVHSDNVTWDAECKTLCSYYATQPIHCPELDSGEGLTACVKRLHPYCA